MVTKCARACIVSGALVGITTPDSPISVAGYARNAEVRYVEKTSRVPQKHRCLAGPADQGFSTTLRLADGDVGACVDTVQESVPVLPLLHSPSPRLSTVRSLPTKAYVLSRPLQKPSSSRRRHLGAFAMTAYT